MAVFDITKNILNTEGFDPLYRAPIEARSEMQNLVAWLSEHVGTFYGGGEDNIKRIGSGWEIFTLYNGKPKAPEWEDSEVTWHVDITDEQKSLLFALKWVK